MIHTSYKYILAALIFLVITITSSKTYAEEYEIRPLTLFLSDDAFTLGRGGVSLGEDLLLPALYRPSLLPHHRRHISFDYSNENVLNIVDGDWRGANGGSISREVSGLLPLPIPMLFGSALAFSAKDFRFAATASATDKDFTYSSVQEDKSHAIAFGVQPLPYIKAGIGWENGRSGQHYFYDGSLSFPDDAFTIGYRRFHRDMLLKTNVSKDTDTAFFEISVPEDVKELFVRAKAADLLEIGFTTENGLHGKEAFCATAFPGSDISIKYCIESRSLTYDSPIIVNGASQGNTHGEVSGSSRGIELNISSPPQSRYTLGIKESVFEIHGAGFASDSAALSFWENLLAGTRFFTYECKVTSLQSFAGIEKRTSERLTLRAGLQYIVTKPEGNFDHWTPFPFLNIGRLDEEISYVQYTKAILGALTAGLTYRSGDIELTYGIGQLIPIRIYKTEDSTGTSGGASGENTFAGTGSQTKSVWDRIRDNPGGNMQSVKLTWYF